ncbi:hypothetical protein TUMEXPCC7403_05090 [Tumidithrix helvetica PCC 7403]|uniref:tetratricopeptide repeat protein n=1 Tax=Tumidithrix helvetica TaxID=3457545 RepID=UPI003C98ACA4
MNSSKKADQLIILLEEAENLIDAGSKTVGVIESVVALVENSIKVWDQSANLIERIPNLINEFNDFKNISQKWDQGAPQKLMNDNFSDRAISKQNYLSQSLHRTASYVQENGIPLANQQTQFRLPFNVLSGGIDPFCSLLLTTGVQLIDGYFTRKTIDSGFSKVSSQLDTINLSIENISVTLEKGLNTLSMQFSWGISELIWRLEENNDFSKKIHETLNRPLETESRELKNRGITSYNRGWYDEALADLLEAEKKSRIDFIIDHYIGNIYLFSEDHRDYKKAIEYYQKAAKYAEPESEYHSIVALIHQGLAHYLFAKDGNLENFKQASTCLERAIIIAKRNNLLSNIPEVLYHHAQYSALAGESKASLSLITNLLADNPIYILKIISEEDFLSLKSEIVLILESLQSEFKRFVDEYLDRYKIFLEMIRRDNSGYYDEFSIDLFLTDIHQVIELYLCGDFISLSLAKKKLVGIAVPISHPRRRVSYYYSYKGKYPYYSYEEIKKIAVYPAPFNCLHPYKVEFSAIGGELL